MSMVMTERHRTPAMVPNALLTDILRSAHQPAI
jgi:hypothetical protein